MAETRSSRDVTRSLHPVVVILAALAVILTFDMLDGTSFFKDIDDELRLLQLRHLLETGGWYDPSLPMIRMPEVYLSPWSRLVDLPYVVIATALSPVFGMELALHVATLVWPPLMLLAVGWLAVEFARAVTPSEELSTLSWLLVGLLLIVAAGEFAPGRIDHHNMQIVLMMLILLGLGTDRRHGGLMIGTGATLSLVIGLECLPFVALALALVAIGFILDVDRSRRILADTGLSMVLVSILAGLLFLGPQGTLATACDAYSAPFITAISGYGACFWLSARFMPARSSWWGRLMVLSLGGAFVTGVLAYLYPLCLAGPYHMIDPVSRLYWFDRILQENNVLAFRQEGMTGLQMLVFLLVMSIIAFFACPIWRAESRGSFRHWAAFLFATSTIVTTIVLIRYVRFPVALMPLYLPLALAVLAAPGASGVRRSLAVLPVLVGMLLIGALYLFIPVEPPRQDSVWLMSADDCRGEDFTELQALPPGRIMAPTGLGLVLASHVPDGVSVAAIPFHRASPGIRQSFTVFAMADDAQRKALLDGYDYVAVCHAPFELPPQEAPFYAALVNDRGWPGLVPLPVKGEGRLRLFRIDHDRLM